MKKHYQIMWALEMAMLFTVFALGKTGSSGAFQLPFWSPQPDVCKPGPKGRIPWILHVRDSDYGWREHTHRAMIALAVNDYIGDKDEMKKMELQLEVELTRDLFRNKVHPIHDSDLALYIHALLATSKNPRNFHGTDLVADLLHRVEKAGDKVNPFLVLALCNAHAVTYQHLYQISKIANLTHETSYPDVNGHPDVDSRIAQMKALVFKALACGIKHDPRNNKFSDEMTTIVNCLHKKYNDEDGSFGNVYTTSLAVQAFTAWRSPPRWWDRRKSVEYLEQESEIDVNLIKAYYIEMALNSLKYNFIRDLYKGPPIMPYSAPMQVDSHYVHYTIKKNLKPNMYFSVSMSVEKGTNFYQIMKRASNVSAAFSFTAYENNNGDPMVYSVSGVPNDVEENVFWRLCRRYSESNNPRTSGMQSHDESPKKLIPQDGDHYMYLYSNAECPPQKDGLLP